MEHENIGFIQFLESHREAVKHWLSLFVRSAPVAMVALESDVAGNLRYIYASSSFHDLYGVAPEDVAADVDAIKSRVHTDDIPPLMEAVAESSRRLSAFHSEFRYQHPRKGEIRIETHGTPLRNSDGSILWYGIDADVTQRRRAESILRDADATLREALDNMMVGCQILDYELRYRYLNENAVRHSRTSRDELLGRKLQEAFPGVETTPLYTVVTNCLEKRTARRMDCEFTYPDGSQALFELSIQPVPEGILILSAEVTQQRMLESQLQQAKKMEAIGRLAGGIAHDFNNLVTVIKNYSELLLINTDENTPQREWVAGIQDACQRSSRLTQQLLTFSRKASLEPTKLNLNAVVDNSVILLRRLIGTNIFLSTELDPSTPAIVADQAQLEQVVLNLSLNARDAMPRGGKLSISTAAVTIGAPAVHETQLPPGLYAELTVRDTGEAIPDDIQSQIFEPFFTTKATGKGTGLGLAVAHGVVTQSGGDIMVVSKPGVGTTFRLLFPAASEDGRPEGSK